jgi:hypothetical protein
VSKAEGQTCGAGGDCGPELVCIGERPHTESSICMRPALVGEACAPNQCTWPALCTEAGTCELAPWPGESCEGQCAFGFCGDDGVCREPLPLGAACEQTLGDECDYRTAYCDGSVCREYGNVCE